MTNIYKSPQYAERFVGYTQSEEFDNIKHDFIIDTNNLTYKLTVSDEIIYNFSITLDEFKANQRFVEQSWFAFHDSFLNQSNTLIVSKNAGLVEFDRNSVINSLDYTSIGKNNYLSQEKFPGWNIPFKIFVKSSSDDFTTMEYSVQVPVAQSTVVTLNNQTYTLLDPKNWKEFISPITATTAETISADSMVEVNVSTDPDIHSIYLDPISGTPDRIKVKLTNGSGKFNISTAGLEAGDNIDIKIGFKSFTHVTRLIKTIS